jgi:POT family proton-dependent oligopeptide transporter
MRSLENNLPLYYSHRGYLKYFIIFSRHTTTANKKDNKMTTASVSEKHPRGLYVLFATEMWERFNYYGMRAILVYFITQALMYNKVFSSQMYGGYTSLMYLTPLVGGYIADRYWGNRRSIMFGGIVMAIAEIVLFFCSYFYKSNPDLSTWFFYMGLGLMIAGNGFFKPNISSMVGQLYKTGDKRTDSAYTIFYMGINLGGMIGPFVCGPRRKYRQPR